LPLLFYVPLLADPMAECFDIQIEREFKNVLLGLGDVILPGNNAPVVSFCARQLGLKEFTESRDDGHPCDIYWHSIVFPDMNSVVKSGMTELAKKVTLTQAIVSMRELFPSEYSFYPRSWILPAQLKEFSDYCLNFEETNNKCFIVKPDDGAQGTGIYLISSPSELLQTNSNRQLIQEYMPDPYLLSDGLKFDLRVYAVIRSLNPLSIYVAREGMARFCTEKYPGMPTKENFSNLYAHLTNYSLNKANNAYIHSKSLKEQLKGSKRLLSTVFHQMEHKGVRTRRLWREIKLIIVKTVLAMVPELMLNYEHHFCDFKYQAPQCFQIIGLDILVRQDGTPILLEVNSSPSLSVDHILAQNENIWIENSEIPPPFNIPEQPVRSVVDEMIKVPLVRDTLLLVLDQLEYHYPLCKENQTKLAGKSDFVGVLNDHKFDKNSIGSTLSIASTIGNLSSKSTIDDLGLLNRTKKPHLSEVFPINYGQTSKHLLVLDKAVYLYLQFCNIKQTLLISLPAIRAFIRKCELTNLITCDALEEKFDEITSLFFGNDKKTAIVVSSGAPALPFRGFLHILFHLAKLRINLLNRKIEDELQLLPALLDLLTHCDSALRRYGVRSARLRRAELIMDNEEEKNKRDENNSTFSKELLVQRSQPTLKIYLLPGRINRRSLEPIKQGTNWINEYKRINTKVKIN
uniref:Tubulin polyglutamylase TTLL11 n=1 Tax=Meloidogyne javanica TaxID=6303 RepID=A0A915MX96_MELJA